jgi:hypothetical protein
VRPSWLETCCWPWAVVFDLEGYSGIRQCETDLERWLPAAAQSCLTSFAPSYPERARPRLYPAQSRRVTIDKGFNWPQGSVKLATCASLQLSRCKAVT